MRGGLSAVLFPFMRTQRKPSKPRTKRSATRNSGNCRSARGGGGKTQRTAPGKVKRKKARKRWVPQRRISDKEVERWCRRIVRGLDRERRRCGISLDDVAGPAGLTRQCLGMVRRRKGASFLSTIVRYFYALNLDWSFVCFEWEGPEKQGSAGGWRGKRQLRIQMGRGRARVAPCHRNR